MRMHSPLLRNGVSFPLPRVRRSDARKGDENATYGSNSSQRHHSDRHDDCIGPAMNPAPSYYALRLHDVAFSRLRGCNPHAYGAPDHGLLKKNSREFLGLRNQRSCGGGLSSGSRPVGGNFRVGWAGFWRTGSVMKWGRRKPPVPGACAGCPNTAGRPNTAGLPTFLGSDIKKNKRFVGGWAKYPFVAAGQAGSTPACG